MCTEVCKISLGWVLMTDSIRLNTSTTFSDVLKNHARSRPDHIAILEPQRNLSITYKELDDLVDQVAIWLDSKGVKQGGVVSVVVKNCIEYFPIYLGAIRLGGIINPFPATLSPFDLLKNLSYTEPDVVVCHDTHSAYIKSQGFNVYELNLRNDIQFFDDISIKDTISVIPDNVLDANSPACLYYSSGTTDDPKGIIYSHENMMSLIESIVKGFGHNDSDQHLILLPLGHTASINYSFLPALYTGATIVLYDSYLRLRTNLWAAIEEHKITYMQVVPSILYSILHTPFSNFNRDQVSSLSYVGCGSAPLSMHMQTEFQDKFDIPVANLYGLSETGPTHFDNPLETQWQPGSIGLPLDVNEIRFVDDEGVDVPIDEVGEIIVKGSNVFTDYFKNHALYSKVVIDGYFYTGDLGYVDGLGKQYFVERKKDLIIKAGVNIHPGEIEEVLYEHKCISEVLVVGIDDEFYGEDVKCFAVLNEDNKAEKNIEQSIINFARERLGVFKAPVSVDFVESLPKGPSGKYLRRALR